MSRNNEYVEDEDEYAEKMSRISRLTNPYADCYENYSEKTAGDDSSRASRNSDEKDKYREQRRRKRSRSSSRRYSRSRSRSRSKVRDDRSRSRSPRHVVYDYHHRSYRRSRSRSRSYDRDREDRDREDYYSSNRRSPYSDEEYSDGNYRYRSSDRRTELQPNCTIVLKGLPPTTDEALMWDIIGRQGFAPKDVRILKKKETGQSRGFGFVEFTDVDEAMRWMEHTQGRLEIDNRHYADLQYSMNKTSSSSAANTMSALNLAAAAAAQLRGGDWICSKCGTNNFKKRDLCFKCNIKRDESDALGGEGFNEIGVMPSDTLLLRNVPVTADEEHILYCLKKLSSLDVRRIVVSRCPETSQSRGYAYIEMSSITEAAQLLTTLTAVTKLNIDGREILVSYSKLPLTSVLAGIAASKNVARLDEWSNRLAFSAGTPVKSIVSVGGIMQTDVTNAAAAVAQSAIKKAQVMRHVAAQQVQAQMQVAASAAHILVPGAALLLQHQHQQILAAQALQEMAAVQLLHEQAASLHQLHQQAAASAPAMNLGTVRTPYGELPRYPFPDTSIYQYEASSGFYFDPTTGLYYDSKTQYYYNAETQQYLYWDSSYQTYLPAPASSSSASASEAPKNQPPTVATAAIGQVATSDISQEIVDKKEPTDKTEKVKIAKKIQKDMEKWAKQLNQKPKPNAAATNATVAQPVGGSVVEQKQSASADVAFSALEKNVGKLSAGLVSYEGGDSDDESSVPVSSSHKSFSPTPTQLDEKAVVDWDKLACLLCRRQFPSKDVLMKHQQYSDLHKQNVEAKLRSLKTSAGDGSVESTGRMGAVEVNFASGSGAGLQYRDRAKERREKFGLDDKPQPNRLKEKYLESLSGPTEEPTVSGLKSDNIGNKLLKSMGWQEGQGLGRKNQGIVDPITQQRRAQGAGLGSTNAVVNASASGTYKDHVRAALRQKFFEQS